MRLFLSIFAAKWPEFSNIFFYEQKSSIALFNSIFSLEITVMILFLSFYYKKFPSKKNFLDYLYWKLKSEHHIYNLISFECIMFLLELIFIVPEK